MKKEIIMGKTLMLIFVIALVFWAEQGLWACGSIIPKKPTPQPYTIKYEAIDVKVDNGIATTIVEQDFINETGGILEATTVFPLPEGAVVKDFATWLGNERLEGKLLDKSQARFLYEDIVRKMKDPALLQIGNNDAFTAKLYPIPPGGEKRIRFEYTQVLPYDNGIYKYSYVLRTASLSKKPLQVLKFRIVIHSKTRLGTIYSPSHTINVEKQDDFTAIVTYTAENIKPDSDFVVYYTISEKELGFSLLTSKEKGQDGFFLLMGTPPVRDDKTKVVPRDIIFVLDKSGSMNGNKINQAKDGLKFCLNSLNAQDRFAVIIFSDTIRMLNEKLILASKDEVNKATSFIDTINANGGTNINEALLQGIKLFDNSGRTSFLVFLTDGLPTVGITNKETIIKNAKEANNQGIRIFTFGVGYDVNTHLLDTLAQKHGGTATYVEPKENIEVAISSFYSKIARPLLSKVTLKIKGVEAYSLYPKEIQEIFSGTQILIFGRYHGDGKAKVILSGLDQTGEAKTFTYDTTFPWERQENVFISEIWASRRIGYLLDEIRLNPVVSKLEEDERVREIIDLSKAYGIVTEYTSFIAEADKDISREELLKKTVYNIQNWNNQVEEGAWAVRQSMNRGGMQQQAQNSNRSYIAQNGEIKETRRVTRAGNQTFYLRGEKWVQNGVNTENAKKVEVFSDEYFRLSKEYPELLKIQSFGKYVVVKVGDEVIEFYEIVPQAQK
jgi:Ca-activated chloride channel family protein